MIPANVPPEAKARRGLSLLFKLGVSVAALLLIAVRVDVAGAITRLAEARPTLLGAAFVVLIFQWPTTATRFWLVSHQAGADLSFGRALSVQLASLLMNQAVPTAGGDAWRTLALQRSGLALRAGIGVAVVDRYFALLGLSTIVLLGQPWFSDLAAGSSLATATSVGLVLVSLALGAVTVIDKWLPRSKLRVVQAVAEFGPLVRQTLTKPSTGVLGLACSVVAHLITVATVFLLARALDVDLSLGSCALLVPPVVLLSALPISLAGWGVREGSSIAMFALARDRRAERRCGLDAAGDYPSWP